MSRTRSPARRPRPVRGLPALLLAPVGALLLGAGQGAELVVGAAASLSEPIAAIAAGYEARHPGVRVRLVLGASSALAEQLRAGAPLAVLVAADPAITAGLAAEGLVEAEPRPRIARNRLALLVREELAPRFAGPAELDGAAIRRIALPAAAVPIGRYAREWLAGRGLLAAVEPRLVAVAHARAALAAVDAGDADAAIVYATDARLATSARSFEIPDAEQPEIAYEAALRTGAGPRAREFLAFLASDEAGRALAAAGLLPPRGVP